MDRRSRNEPRSLTYLGITRARIHVDVHALMPFVLHAGREELRVQRDYSMLLIGPTSNLWGKEPVIININIHEHPS